MSQQHEIAWAQRVRRAWRCLLDPAAERRRGHVNAHDHIRWQIATMIALREQPGSEHRPLNRVELPGLRAALDELDNMSPSLWRTD